MTLIPQDCIILKIMDFIFQVDDELIGWRFDDDSEKIIYTSCTFKEL